ncbi:MAG: AAA family ATPase [Phenylobacterium sp.]|nr:AAA family ATPase [Phenylobacterium sp.]
MAPDSRLPASAYGPGFYEQVYDTLFSEAGQALAAGRAVVLDATFISPALRRRAEALATSQGVDFDGVWLEAPVETLAARIDARHGDASDATVETLRKQLDQEVGAVQWARIDASGSADEAAEAWSHLQTPA